MTWKPSSSWAPAPRKSIGNRIHLLGQRREPEIPILFPDSRARRKTRGCGFRGKLRRPRIGIRFLYPRRRNIRGPGNSADPARRRGNIGRRPQQHPRRNHRKLHDPQGCIGNGNLRRPRRKWRDDRLDEKGTGKHPGKNQRNGRKFVRAADQNARIRRWGDVDGEVQRGQSRPRRSLRQVFAEGDRHDPQPQVSLCISRRRLAGSALPRLQHQPTGEREHSGRRKPRYLLHEPECQPRHRYHRLPEGLPVQQQRPAVRLQLPEQHLLQAVEIDNARPAPQCPAYRGIRPGGEYQQPVLVFDLRQPGDFPGIFPRGGRGGDHIRFGNAIKTGVTMFTNPDSNMLDATAS